MRFAVAGSKGIEPSRLMRCVSGAGSRFFGPSSMPTNGRREMLSSVADLPVTAQPEVSTQPVETAAAAMMVRHVFTTTPQRRPEWIPCAMNGQADWYQENAAALSQVFRGKIAIGIVSGRRCHFAPCCRRWLSEQKFLSDIDFGEIDAREVRRRDDSRQQSLGLTDTEMTGHTSDF